VAELSFVFFTPATAEASNPHKALACSSGRLPCYAGMLMHGLTGSRGISLHG
jgi:hypothetical protein